ncbi:Gfo/Idh/MocA family protein [Nakamurella endophytica]|uniref:Dehydrogenase n=1 Tax=Nakamurella endophytica TaxID=1748367 RepID=A0A917SV81_9ACTN|nr:Gfo/Idh/MocA family oxidoreductase [Nakamurella endophytica]GGL99235.1 dehydrogenase [Nakamurella endophytica]
MTLRVGLVSFAHVHAAGYAALLREWPGVSLLALDPDADTAPAGELRGAAMAESLGVELAGSAEEFWARRPDAVVVCTENARHRPWVEAAAHAGAAVLCEKPLATTLADAEALVAACDAAGVLLMTAYPVGFHPAFASLTRSVRAGAIGTVIAATGTNNGGAPIDHRSWFGDAALAGGGALMDHVVHLADLLDVVVPAPAVQVYARTNRVVHADRVDVETGGLVAITYGDGTHAVLDCSWSVPPGYPAWGGLTLRVEGSRGAVEFDPFGERLAVYSGDERWQDYGPDLDRLMLAEFLDCVRTGRRPRSDGAAGLRTLRIVLAAQRSAELGTTVPVGGS